MLWRMRVSRALWLVNEFEMSVKTNLTNSISPTANSRCPFPEMSVSHSSAYPDIMI
jgi:hypothetical protein